MLGLLDCGHASAPVPAGGGAAGYCRDHSGRTCCYPCADAIERAELAKSDRFFCYVSQSGRGLTTWTGGDLGLRVVSWGNVVPRTRHSPYGERRYLRALDSRGRAWWGTGAPGMFAKIRLCRGRES